MTPTTKRLTSIGGDEAVEILRWFAIDWLVETDFSQYDHPFETIVVALERGQRGYEFLSARLDTAIAQVKSGRLSLREIHALQPLAQPWPDGRFPMPKVLDDVDFDDVMRRSKEQEKNQSLEGDRRSLIQFLVIGVFYISQYAQDSHDDTLAMLRGEKDRTATFSILGSALFLSTLLSVGGDKPPQLSDAEWKALQGIVIAVKACADGRTD